MHKNIYICLFGALCAWSSLGDTTPLQPGAAVNYKPFFPDRWEKKQQSTSLIPWQGEQIVFLTTTADFDPAVMTIFVSRLDAAWKLYADLTGKHPPSHRPVSGKTAVAAVPDHSYTCGLGCGYLGAAGIEVGGFYQHDYPLVQKNPQAFPHLYFYEIGRNYSLFPQMPSFATGYAVFMRYVCMDALKCDDPETALRQRIEAAEAQVRASDLSFLAMFTMSDGLTEKQPRLKHLAPSDQPVMYASVMLKLRQDYGGDAWVKRFFHYLTQCPPIKTDHSSAEHGLAQGLNWVAAASCAAGQNLLPLFEERWRFPATAAMRSTFATADWKAPGLSPRSLLTP